MRDGWVGDYNDPFTFSQLFYSANDMNHPGYASERYDELIEAAAAEMDPARRADLLQQAEVILLEDMPIIPIYFYVSKTPDQAVGRRLAAEYHGSSLHEESVHPEALIQTGLFRFISSPPPFSSLLK